MIEILDQFLSDNTSPELKEDLSAAYEILERLNLPRLDTDFEALLMVDEMYNTGDTMQAINDELVAKLQMVLKQHTIIYDESTPMVILTKSLQVLMRIAEFEDKNALIALCDTTLSPNEVICEICALVGGHHMEEFLPWVQECGVTLIEKIRKLASINAVPESDATGQEYRQKFIDNIKHYLFYLMEPNLLIAQFLKDGMAVGYSFETYAEQVGRGFEGMYPDRAAQELVGMAIVSSDGSSNPRAIISEQLEHYVSSVSYTTKIIIEVDKILAGYKP